MKKYDNDRDGDLFEAEFRDDPDLGGHFGWLDTNADHRLTVAEWNETRRLISIGDFGAIALRPGAARGEIAGKAVAWRFKKNLPFVAALLVYQGVLYLVKGWRNRYLPRSRDGQDTEAGSQPGGIG